MNIWICDFCFVDCNSFHSDVNKSTSWRLEKITHFYKTGLVVHFFYTLSTTNGKLNVI